MDKIKLFCIPYAGGSATIYNRWKPHLHENIELIPIELAGRGRRIHNSFYNSIEEAVLDVYGNIKNQLNDSPYCLFGHSMGGIIAYELAQKICEEKLQLPMHLFFSGRSAPHVKREDEKIYHEMNEIEFKEEIIQLGGTPKEFFEYPELMEVLLPLLKNDFKINESYQHDRKLRPLDMDMTILIGKDDDVIAEQVHGWREHTSRTCRVYYFNGDHFFINTAMENVVEMINDTLTR